MRLLHPDVLERIGQLTFILTLMGTAHDGGVSHDSGPVQDGRKPLARLGEEQRALRRVALLVAKAAAPETVFAAVAEEARRLLAADIATIDRFDSEDMMTVVAVRGATHAAPAIGSQTPGAQTGNAARVRATERPSRIDRYAEEISSIGYRSGFRAAVSAPITVGGQLWGAMTVASTREDEPFPRGTEERLAEFTEVVTVAIANAEARDELRQVAAEQTALRRVATLVARASSPEEIFATVTEEVGRLLDVDLAVLARYDGGSEIIVAGWSARGKLEGIGRSTPLGGRNLSTIVRDTGRPARFEDYGEASGEVAVRRRSWGVRAIVGVPITVEAEIRGVMAVASTTDRPLPGDAEERLASFTELLATAYANAEAREVLRRVADEQAALRRVATLVARGTPPDPVFAAVAEEVGTLLPATELALVGRYLPDEWIQYVGAWSAVGDPGWLGARVRLGGHDVSTLVSETGRPGRIDHLDEETSAVTALAREHGARSSIGAPIEVEGRLWGVVIVAAIHKAVLPPGTERELVAFTGLVATAIANAQARTDVTASRARIVSSADETRRRIVRDLHDGAQQRLVHTIITLELARRAQESHDGEAATALVGEALEHAQRTNRELRELVHGILPSVLQRGGLIAAVDELVTRMRVPVDLDVTDDRFSADIEANAYFVIAEALTNVAKHSGARRAEVTARADDGALYVEVRDDGVGGATPDGTGLRGLGDRVAALGGQLQITSPVGAGTHLAARLPRR